MKTIISAYVNCSMGGMGTVLRNRALHDEDSRHLLYFTKDAGGRGSFAQLNDTDLRITERARLPASIQYACQELDVSEISIISMPDVAVAVNNAGLGSKLVYEIHTSDAKVIGHELGILQNFGDVRVRVPSLYTRDQVDSIRPAGLKCHFEVVPNTVDVEIFKRSGSAVLLDDQSIPLVWVGRLDKGKNPNDLLRVLKILPMRYVGIFVITLESGPDRFSDFIGLAAQYGVLDRISVFSDISQSAMADLFRGARRQDGVFVSTSLAESFGYSVLEASLCGLPVVAYQVGAIGEHQSDLIHLVSAGSVQGLSAEILDIASLAPSN